MAYTTLKETHSLKNLNLLPLIKKIRSNDVIPVNDLARFQAATDIVSCTLQELKDAFVGLSGEPLEEILQMAGRSTNLDNARLAVHLGILHANEFGQPKGQVLQESSASTSQDVAVAEPPVKKSRIEQLEKSKSEEVQILKTKVRALSLQQEPQESLSLITLDEMDVKDGASIGDTVRILNDEEKVQNLQDGHGGYDQNMKHYLGTVGQIIKVDSDGDLSVKFGRRWFMYNPKCCLPAPGETVYEGSANDGGDDDGDDDYDQSAFNNPLMHMLKASGFAEEMSQSVTIPILFVATSQNDLSQVKKILTDNPGSVNTTYNGITPLCMASNQGYRDIVEELLNKGADVNKVDKDGDTALMSALDGKEPAIGKLLIERGTDVNIVNNNGKTALRVAAICDYSSLVEMIINKGCDVNLQDFDGNTALHAAISSRSKDSIAVLCKVTNLGIVNKEAFNMLHYAAFKDQAIAVDTILDLDQSLVNVKKPDGFTALHIAAANNHTECAKLLIEKGNADVNSKILNGSTPLMLAAKQGNLACVQLLIQKDADVNALDGMKNSPLHGCCTGRNSRVGVEQLLATMIGLSVNTGSEDRIQVAKYLVENGARTDIKNVDGKTPVECCTDVTMKRRLAEFITQKQGGGAIPFPESEEKKTLAEILGLPVPCARCMSRMANITLQPCGHKCVCRGCALKADICPVCEQSNSQRMAIGGTEEPECSIQ